MDAPIFPFLSAPSGVQSSKKVVLQYLSAVMTYFD
jgi:hypothetical protein